MKKKIEAIQSKLMPHFKGLVFANGNRKLDKNVLTVNLSSAHNCPSKALSLCKVADICYAYATEHRWPYTKRKNMVVEAWIQTASYEDIISMLRAYIEGSHTAIKYIRLNESGDFLDQQQVYTWSRIAKYCEDEWGIKTHCFTARADLDFTGVHFVVNGSRPDIVGMHREYRVLSKEDYDALPDRLQPGNFKCHCHCKTCHVCFNDKFHGVIYCRKH